MKLLLISLFSLFLIARVSAQENHLLVGSGGGIAGTQTVFKIERKGRVFKGQGTIDITYDLCGRIKKSVSKQIFDQAENLETVAFQHPGNRYFFVEYVSLVKTTKVVWGDLAQTPPQEILDLYQEIQNELQEIRFKPFKKK